MLVPLFFFFLHVFFSYKTRWKIGILSTPCFSFPLTLIFHFSVLKERHSLIFERTFSISPSLSLSLFLPLPTPFSLSVSLSLSPSPHLSLFLYFSWCLSTQLRFEAYVCTALKLYSLKTSYSRKLCLPSNSDHTLWSVYRIHVFCYSFRHARPSSVSKVTVRFPLLLASSLLRPSTRELSKWRYGPIWQIKCLLPPLDVCTVWSAMQFSFLYKKNRRRIQRRPCSRNNSKTVHVLEMKNTDFIEWET